MSPQSCAVKTLWSQWECLFTRNSVLCHKWESGWGEQTFALLILLESFWQTAFESHHTAVVLRLQVVVVLLARTYFSSSHIGHQVPAWGRKHHAPLKQYTVGPPMERITIDILGPLPETCERTNLYWWLVTIIYLELPNTKPGGHYFCWEAREQVHLSFLCTSSTS